MTLQDFFNLVKDTHHNCMLRIFLVLDSKPQQGSDPLEPQSSIVNDR